MVSDIKICKLNNMISTMRNVIIKCQYFIFAFTLFAMFFVSCDNGDIIDSSLPKVLYKVDEVENLKGVMHYDRSYQIWYISVDNNGLGNSIQRLDIWGEGDPAFQEENLQILFSGDIFRWNDNALDDPLNSGNYVVIISQIQKLSENL